MNWYSAGWYYFNVIMCLPIFLLSFYRLRYQAPHSLIPDKVKLDFADYGYKFAVGVSLSYYTIDSFYLTYRQDIMDWCNFSFLIHHLVTLSGGYEMFNLPHYPWYIIMTWGVHSLLLLFPHITNLNYVYLAIMLTVLYGLNNEPYNKL